MRILIDIGHPAHVHFFRHAITELEHRGHVIAVTAQPKDVTFELLDSFQIPYTVISSPALPSLLRPVKMLVRDWRLWKFCRKFKPDVLTTIGGIWAPQVAFAMRKPSIAWDDTEHAKFGHLATRPFATAIYSPDCYNLARAKKQHFYPGTHDLAYLHPNRFKPDIAVVRDIGIDPAESYCIIRLVSWQAVHDIGQRGFASSKLLDFIKSIEQFARPYITSEKPLPEELKAYQLRIPVHLIHHVMAFASLCVGEGATMMTESAVLGTPAVYINTLGAGVIDMFEEYGLLRQTADTDEALRICLDWLKDPEAKEKCLKAKDKLLSDKIDVTDFIVESIEKTAG